MPAVALRAIKILPKGATGYVAKNPFTAKRMNGKDGRNAWAPTTLILTPVLNLSFSGLYFSNKLKWRNAGFLFKYF